MPEVLRRLVAGDETTVDHFLVPHTSSSMFLRSNMRRGGLDYQAGAFQGVYVGAFVSGELTDVAALYWNGNMIVQAPRHAPQLARFLLSEAPQFFKGLLGPQAQVDLIRDTLSLPLDGAQSVDRELLFELELADLVRPVPLENGAVTCRRTTDGDLDLLLEWRVAYARETLNEPETAKNRSNTREYLHRYHASGQQYVLEAGGNPIASCTFNAMLDDTVQIGGVWTPPELRRNGYGRSIVAGALEIARSEGMQRAILFTGEDNIPAQRAYRSLGFTHIGGYGLMIFGYDVRRRLRFDNSQDER